MKKTLLALAAAATLSAGLALPAKADPFGGITVEIGGPRHGDYDRDWRWHRRSIGPGQAARIVRDRGFPRILSVSRFGERYMVRAARWNGRVFLVTLEARDGDILSIRPLGFHRY